MVSRKSIDASLRIGKAVTTKEATTHKRKVKIQMMTMNTKGVFSSLLLWTLVKKYGNKRQKLSRESIES